MYNLKISVNAYTANNWRNLEKNGEIEISAEVDALSEDYEKLKLQVNELLAKVNAENRLISDLHQVEQELQSKQKTLKDFNEALTRTKAQLNRLNGFLKRLGINPNDYSLEINTPSLGTATADDSGADMEVEVDPIPFDEGTNEPSQEF